MSEDRYATFDYNRLISWDERLKREWPLLDELLAGAPSRDVLDLGSGTGEHARFLASKGYRVVGVDSSPAMLEKARSAAVAGTEFVQGDMRNVAAAVHDRFGAALCLGNALPHLTGEDDLGRMAEDLRKVLLPDAPAIIQFLNYDRIEAKRERALPLNFLPDPNDPKASIIFLRAMDLRPDRSVVFMPTILRMRSDREPPIELVGSQRVDIRGWRATEVESAFRSAGFTATQIWGSYQKAAFEPTESRDVILVAR